MSHSTCIVHALGVELLEQVVLPRLDAVSLARVGATCKAFRALTPNSHLRLCERVARAAVLQMCCGNMADALRWCNLTWLERLDVEEATVGFDRAWEVPAGDDAMASGFRFVRAAACTGAASSSSGSGGVAMQIQLQGMGPKLLLSDASTAARRVLRWRVVVRGNTAVEFGIVPAGMRYAPPPPPPPSGDNGDDDDDQGGAHEHHPQQQQQQPAANSNFDPSKVHKALHKCKTPDGADFREAVGLSSTITVGSMLPVRAPLMKGSVVEVVVRRGRLDALVLNPPEAHELFWQGAGHQARTVPKLYRGPACLSLQQHFSPDADVRLALTAWAQGAFDVLENAPRSLENACGGGAGSAAAAATATATATTAAAAAAGAAAAPTFAGVQRSGSGACSGGEASGSGGSGAAANGLAAAAAAAAAAGGSGGGGGGGGSGVSTPDMAGGLAPPDAHMHDGSL